MQAAIAPRLGCHQCLSQDLDFFSKKGVIKKI